jgi:hypothetical protein
MYFKLSEADRVGDMFGKEWRSSVQFHFEDVGQYRARALQPIVALRDVARPLPAPDIADVARERFLTR